MLRVIGYADVRNCDGHVRCVYIYAKKQQRQITQNTKQYNRIPYISFEIWLHYLYVLKVYQITDICGLFNAKYWLEKITNVLPMLILMHDINTHSKKTIKKFTRNLPNIFELRGKNNEMLLNSKAKSLKMYENYADTAPCYIHKVNKTNLSENLIATYVFSNTQNEK